MIIDFNKNLIGLDGKPMIENDQPIFLSRSLANNLVNGAKGDAIKFYDWALKLYREGVLDLDRRDWEVLKQFVSDLDTVSILYRAQLLQCFVLSPDQ